ncbi:hypothetical protein ABIC83_002960 [Roseateles asaccharophilus]|uniref:hypothetical protein n=1 Tax=Roseateles asaccharophilus TaxID=582607 RepID=UPI003838F50E
MSEEAESIVGPVKTNFPPRWTIGYVGNPADGRILLDDPCGRYPEVIDRSSSFIGLRFLWRLSSALIEAGDKAQEGSFEFDTVLPGWSIERVGEFDDGKLRVTDPNTGGDALVIFLRDQAMPMRRFYNLAMDLMAADKATKEARLAAKASATPDAPSAARRMRP